MIGKLLSSHELMCRYTKSELIDSVTTYLTTKTAPAKVTELFGVPRRTLQRWTAKVCRAIGVKELKDAQVKIKNGDVSRQKLKDILSVLVSKGKQ